MPRQRPSAVVPLTRWSSTEAERRSFPAVTRTRLTPARPSVARAVTVTCAALVRVSTVVRLRRSGHQPRCGGVGDRGHRDGRRRERDVGAGPRERDVARQVVHGQVRGVGAGHAAARHGQPGGPGVAGTVLHPHRVLRRDLPLRPPQLGEHPADAGCSAGAAGVRDGDRQGHDSGTSGGVDRRRRGGRRADDRVTVVGRHAAGQCGRSGGRADRRTGEKGQRDDDRRRDDAPGPPHVPTPLFVADDSSTLRRRWVRREDARGQGSVKGWNLVQQAPWPSRRSWGCRCSRGSARSRPRSWPPVA